jgi:hypothetical protein
MLTAGDGGKERYLISFFQKVFEIPVLAVDDLEHGDFFRQV